MAVDTTPVKWPSVNDVFREQAPPYRGQHLLVSLASVALLEGLLQDTSRAPYRAQ